MMQTTDESLRLKAQQIYEILLETYGHKPLQRKREPLQQLVSTMLSHRTTWQNERRAFDRMWEKYGSWEAIRDAPVDDLIASISPATFPEVKAPNIQRTLARIIEERGQPNIDFLADWPLEQSLAWLLSLPGVGLKTATLVLLFTFAQPVMPVDTHVHRVSQRTGLIGPKITHEVAHRVLLTLLPADPQVLYNFHVNMLKHGQQICTWNNPHCERCPLQAVCDYYQKQR